jgi:hypothetical protein
MLRALVSLAVASRSTVGLQAKSFAVTGLLNELSLKSSSSIEAAISRSVAGKCRNPTTMTVE